MANLQGFRDLRVWQDAMDLVIKVMKLTESLPHHELYGLGSQIRRSAISVPSNIAEGWGRNGDKEFMRFLDIAYGSLCELDTQLEIMVRYYNTDTKELVQQCESIRKQLFTLHQRLESK